MTPLTITALGWGIGCSVAALFGTVGLLRLSAHHRRALLSLSLILAVAAVANRIWLGMHAPAGAREDELAVLASSLYLISALALLLGVNALLLYVAHSESGDS